MVVVMLRFFLGDLRKTGVQAEPEPPLTLSQPCMELSG